MRDPPDEPTKNRTKPQTCRGNFRVPSPNPSSRRVGFLSSESSSSDRSSHHAQGCQGEGTGQFEALLARVAKNARETAVSAKKH